MKMKLLPVLIARFLAPLVLLLAVGDTVSADSFGMEQIGIVGWWNSLPAAGVS